MQKKGVTIKILASAVIIFAIVTVTFAISSGNSHNMSANETMTPSSTAVNQHNNLVLHGFSLIINEDVYFADGVGIHKTDRTFRHVETLVLNENYQENLATNRTAFSSLQYYNGRVFFRSEVAGTTIYSMYPNGSNLTRILDAADISMNSGEAGKGQISSSMVVANEKIYFIYISAPSHTHLMAFDLQTGEITDFDIHDVGLLTICLNRNALQFSSWRQMDGLGFLNFDDYTVEFFRPSNFVEEWWDEDWVSIFYTTNSDGIIAFSDGYSRIFVINEEGYAEEVYHTSEYYIEGYEHAALYFATK